MNKGRIYGQQVLLFLLWTLQSNKMEPSPLNLVQLLRLMMLHSHHGGLKRHYSHNEAFWAEQGWPPKLVQKCIETTGRRDWLEAFIWLGVGTGLKLPEHGWTACWQKKKKLGLYYQLAISGAENEEGRVRLKSYQQPNIKKWSHTLNYVCLLQRNLKESRKVICVSWSP